MAQMFPWHSIRQSDRNVYHDDDQCPVGRKIEEKYRRAGHRCRQRCRVCTGLRDPARQKVKPELLPL